MPGKRHLVHEDRTFNPFYVPQLVHNAIQIFRLRMIELHGLLVYGADDAVPSQEANALHHFGGGGHARAAGCTLSGTFHDCVNNLSLHIEKQLNAL